MRQWSIVEVVVTTGGDRPETRADPTAIGWFLALVAGLAAFNVVRVLVIPDAWGTPANLVTALAVAAVARAARLDAAELGLERRHLGDGLRWGGGFAAVVLAFLLTAAAIPALHGTLADDRVHVSAGAMLVQVLVTIPIGTVILEELAFRGVLLALARRRWSTVVAVAVTSVLFGCWHIAPALVTADDNPSLTSLSSSAAGLVLTAVGTVILTGIAGVIFAVLRVRSRSLLAPVLAHIAINSFTFAIAWAVAR